MNYVCVYVRYSRSSLKRIDCEYGGCGYINKTELFVDVKSCTVFQECLFI
jgi:hypothetical protein